MQKIDNVFLFQEPPEAMVLEPPEAHAPHGAGSVPQPSALEALLGQGNFPAMFIPPDADDETMVELAIALSLQDQVLFVFYSLFCIKSGYPRQHSNDEENFAQ